MGFRVIRPSPVTIRFAATAAADCSCIVWLTVDALNRVMAVAEVAAGIPCMVKVAVDVIRNKLAVAGEKASAI